MMLEILDIENIKIIVVVFIYLNIKSFKKKKIFHININNKIKKELIVSIFLGS